MVAANKLDTEVDVANSKHSECRLICQPLVVAPQWQTREPHLNVLIILVKTKQMHTPSSALLYPNPLVRQDCFQLKSPSEPFTGYTHIVPHLSASILYMAVQFDPSHLTDRFLSGQRPVKTSHDCNVDGLACRTTELLQV